MRNSRDLTFCMNIDFISNSNKETVQKYELIRSHQMADDSISGQCKRKTDIK